MNRLLMVQLRGLPGPKKTAAEKHYVKAVAAQKKMDEKTCLSELAATTMALK